MAGRTASFWHRFCFKYLPFLFIVCPLGNRHWRWNQICRCGKHEHCGKHRSDTYEYKRKDTWMRLRTGELVKPRKYWK
jgi:hypothetical protein